MAPYRVAKKWKTREVIREEDLTTWLGTPYTETTYRVEEYERREYYNPDNGQTYSEDVMVDSYTETRKEGW